VGTNTAGKPGVHAGLHQVHQLCHPVCLAGTTQGPYNYLPYFYSRIVSGIKYSTHMARSAWLVFCGTIQQALHTHNNALCLSVQIRPQQKTEHLCCPTPVIHSCPARHSCNPYMTIVFHIQQWSYMYMILCVVCPCSST
jgi:hypothetical protein